MSLFTKLTSKQEHIIVVLTDVPVKQVPHCPNLVGRLTKWSIKMFGLSISYEANKALKAQLFAYFIAEMNLTYQSQPTLRSCIQTDHPISKKWGQSHFEK